MKILTPAEAESAHSNPITEEIASLNARLAEGTRWTSVNERIADAIAASARESGWIVTATADSTGMFVLLDFEVPS